MFTESKITEIYCLADDFCKEFTKQQTKYMLEDQVEGHTHRNKPNRMSDSEIMVILKDSAIQRLRLILRITL